MAEYIKREDAIDILNEFREEAGKRGDTEVEGTCMLARNEIIDLPSIDIIRCKDCKYQHSNGDGTGWCDRAIINGDEMSCVVANDDDFCSYGERRGQE